MAYLCAGHELIKYGLRRLFKAIEDKSERTRRVAEVEQLLQQ